MIRDEGMVGRNGGMEMGRIDTDYNPDDLMKKKKMEEKR